MSDNKFFCKGKQLARFLIEHGSKLIESKKDRESNWFTVFIFENDETIELNLQLWEKEKKKCLF